MNKKDLAKAKKQLLETTDKLGVPIESGIFDTVLYLNSLGFPTTQSCEGHIGQSLVAPWVEITPKLPENKSWYKVKKNRQKVEKQISTLANKLHNLLAEFYQKDKPDYKLILILSEMGYSIRLHSAGLTAIQALSKEKQKKILPAYQKEMKRFTKFLKTKL